MKRRFLFTLLFIGQFSFAFSQGPVDSNAVRYYKVLITQQIDISLKVIKLSECLEECNEMAERSDSFRVDKAKFDTLVLLYNETSKMLNKSITTVIDLTEVDSAIGLKEPVLFILRGYSKMLSEYFPLFISLVQNKGKEYTPEQTLTINNTYERFTTLMKDLEDHVEVLEIAISDFLTKYNLTEDEILKGGW